MYDANWRGRAFTVVDTGGWEPAALGLQAQVSAQAEIGAFAAQVVVMVVDATVGATDTDEAVARVLRKARKPVVLVANKVDTAQERVRRIESLVVGSWRAVRRQRVARTRQR